MKKKALSSVVATVLLLLLTVAAVATLSGIIIPFVKNQLNGSTDCAKYKDSFSFAEEVNGINYNCYNNTKGIGAVSIKAKAAINESDENIDGFQISFQSDAKSESFEMRKTGGATKSWVLGDKGRDYYFVKAGETVSYGFELSDTYNKAEIRPILKTGKICDKSDEIELIKCQANIDI